MNGRYDDLEGGGMTLFLYFLAIKEVKDTKRTLLRLVKRAWDKNELG